MSFLNRLWDILNTQPDSTNIIENKLSELTQYIEDRTIKAIFNLLLEVSKFLERIILTTPSKYMKSPYFWEIYHTIIYLSLIILFVSIMIFSFNKIQNKDNANFISKILIYPLAIVISPYLLLKAIDIFNRIARQLITTDVITFPDQTTFGSIIGFIIYLIAINVLSLKLIFFYAKRLILIVTFAICSPIIFAVWCIPKYSNIVDNWISKILGLLMSQVIHAIILLILGNIIMGVSKFDNVMALVFQIGALGVMNDIEDILSLFKGTDRLTSTSLSGQINDFQSKAKKVKKGAKIVKGVIRRFI